MATEIEARLLGVDVPALEARLRAAGAERTEDGLFREVLFHLAGTRDVNGYVRVRDDGTRVILTYKRRRVDAALRRADEIEVIADDFDRAVALLDGAGLTRMQYREKRRTSYRLGDATISLDRYPGIPPYAEVEAPTDESVRQACRAIGLDPGAHFSGGVNEVYAHYGKPLAPGQPIAFGEQQRRQITEAVAAAQAGEKSSARPQTADPQAADPQATGAHTVDAQRTQAPATGRP